MNLPGTFPSTLLVGAQFGLLALMLLWPAPWHLDAATLLLAAAGLALGIWVLLHNRPGNFNVRPELKAGARLVTDGPYRWVRHPMYGALLLAAAALVAAGGGVQALAWVALVAVLHLKAAREERLLLQRWPEYAAYRARTRRFVPWLW